MRLGMKVAVLMSKVTTRIISTDELFLSRFRRELSFVSGYRCLVVAIAGGSAVTVHGRWCTIEQNKNGGTTINDREKTC